jgi:dolichol-phosphate mannosyltransferase
MKISIVIPAYNEEFRIGRTLEEYSKFFRKKKKLKEISGFEILVVLNACRDGTLDVVKKFKKKYGEIRFLDFEQGGKGFAIVEGFKDALKRDNSLIGFVDADMATSPEAYYDLVEQIGPHGGVTASRWIKGSKVNRSSGKYIRSKGFNFIVRSMGLVNQRDTQCGAKLFKREVIEKIHPSLVLTEWAFDINLLFVCKKNKFEVKEIPTKWEDQEDSKINFARTPLQMLLGAVRLRLIYSPFAQLLKPVKFILIIGDKLVNKK